MVKTFAADGSLLRPHALGSIERLLVLGRITVTRTSRGKISSAHYRNAVGGTTVVSIIPSGTRFVFRETVGSYKIWQHDAAKCRGLAA